MTLGLCFADIENYCIAFSLSYVLVPFFFVDFVCLLFQNPSLRLFQLVPKQHTPKSKIKWFWIQNSSNFGGSTGYVSCCCSFGTGLFVGSCIPQV